MRFSEKGRDWRLPVLLYMSILVLCGESEDHVGEGVYVLLKYAKDERRLEEVGGVRLGGRTSLRS